MTKTIENPMPPITCADCGVPLSGQLNVHTATPANTKLRVGFGWICEPCCAKYPTARALLDRTAAESARNARDVVP